jgi:rhodanese-related sulfurtransferase
MTSLERSAGYAGDLNPLEAWSLLEQDPDAQLLDVRTQAEQIFVGVPDVSPLGRNLRSAPWQTWPGMAPNRNFVAEAAERLREAGAGPQSPVLLLCRSGARSRAAAMALTQAGFGRAYNIAEGFEGNPDPSGHRGVLNGWKARGLAWRQD